MIFEERWASPGRLISIDGVGIAALDSNQEVAPGVIELTIESIRVSLMNYQRVVILKEKESDRYLPIWIGLAEARRDRSAPPGRLCAAAPYPRPAAGCDR